MNEAASLIRDPAGVLTVLTILTVLLLAPLAVLHAAQAKADVVDSVSLARETLKVRGGDCDDLTVLFCSLLESVSIPTAYILVPGHIYAAFDTGVPAAAWQDVHPERRMTFAFDGSLWVPLEVTLIEKSDFLAVPLGPYAAAVVRSGARARQPAHRGCGSDQAARGPGAGRGGCARGRGVVGDPGFSARLLGLRPALVSPEGPDRLRVVFDEPELAVAPGQSAVLYDGDLVVGGGVIDEAVR